MRPRLLLLLASLGLVMCAWPHREQPPAPRAPETVVLVLSSEDITYEYQEVAEARADVVLVVEFSIPDFGPVDPWRVPLKRNPAALMPGLRRVWFGWCTVGERGGYGGGLGIGSGAHTESSVDVSLSLHWTARDGAQGEARYEIQAPWLGEVVQGRGVGAWARVYFTKPG
jgi:hypothetical protein